MEGAKEKEGRLWGGTRLTKKAFPTEKGSIVYWVSSDWDPGKKTLFFLHGLTADHTMFEGQVSFFAPSCNLLFWDAPAHGQSRPYADYSYGEAAEAMKGILNVLGVKKAVFIGQSMGGFFVQAFLLRHPEYGEAFVAIDSTPYGDYYSRSDKWWLRQVEWMAALFPGGLLSWSMAVTVAATKRGRENMRAMLEGYTKRELCHLMGMGYRGFLEDNREMTLPCPVLLICGEKDVTGKVKTYNKAWTKRTGYPLLWLAGAAHNSNVDCQETVNEAIGEFLGRMGDRSKIGDRS